MFWAWDFAVNKVGAAGGLEEGLVWPVLKGSHRLLIMKTVRCGEEKGSNQSGVEGSDLILKAWRSQQDLGAGQTYRFSGPAPKLLGLRGRAGPPGFVKPCRWF